jgi:hypothetical protein
VPPLHPCALSLCLSATHKHGVQAPASKYKGLLQQTKREACCRRPALGVSPKLPAHCPSHRFIPSAKGLHFQSREAEPAATCANVFEDWLLAGAAVALYPIPPHQWASMATPAAGQGFH